VSSTCARLLAKTSWSSTISTRMLFVGSTVPPDLVRSPAVV
jgi:hypothetical protein